MTAIRTNETRVYFQRKFDIYNVIYRVIRTNLSKIIFKFSRKQILGLTLGALKSGVRDQQEIV